MTTTQTKVNQTAAPTLTSATAVAGGGSMPASAQYYVITACGAWGESVVSAEKTATPAAGGHIDLVIASPPAGTTSIRVYRGGSASGENVLVAILGGPWTGTFTDTYASAGGIGSLSPPATSSWGAATKSGAVPTKANMPAGQPAAVRQNIYAGLIGWCIYGGTGAGATRNRKYLLAAGYDVQEA
jgi:hypothetical protein